MNNPHTTSPAQLRTLIRRGEHTSNTSGMAPGFVQCNVVIVPREAAGDFLRFCEANPKPCPVLAVGEPGSPTLAALGGIDIRRDLPRYRIFEHGTLQHEPTNIDDYWRDDLVTFALGCSFSFEEALLNAGLEVRNITEGVNVPMYASAIACEPAGRFEANMVVSMRPFMAKEAIAAIEISSRFPRVHGAPVHLGDPQLIGIENLAKPDFGDAVTIAPGEIPLFWACGVTPQVALMNAKLPFAITHSPGCMLITDMRNSELATR